MIPAALASKALGRPVKLVYTRPDDVQFDCPRSASVQTFKAGFDGEDAITAVDHAAAAGWPTKTLAPGFLADAVAGDIGNCACARVGAWELGDCVFDFRKTGLGCHDVDAT